MVGQRLLVVEGLREVRVEPPEVDRLAGGVDLGLERTPGGPGAPRWVVPTSDTSRIASLLYKYPNIPETLGESTKINSNRRKFQKP
jgi:hypothetical protein